MPAATDIPLWLLIGLPGSGKSTWAQSFQKTGGAIAVVSTDRIREELFGDEATQGPWLQVWAKVARELRGAIAHTRDAQLTGAIYDATNTQRQGRREVITVARALGFNRMTAVWLDVPLVECLRRNQQRSRQVPTEIIHTMARQLADGPPHCDEGFDAIYRLRP